MSTSPLRYGLALSGMLLFVSVSASGPIAKADAPPRVDRFGDPLPPGAIARLGSTRFRSSHPLSSLAYTADGKFLVGGSDNGAWIWDAASGRLCRRLGKELSGAVVVSQDGKLAAVGGGGKKGCAVYEIAGGHRRWLYGFDNLLVAPRCFSPDGKLLAATIDHLPGDGNVHLLDVTTGTLLPQWKTSKLYAAAVAFTPDGKALLTAERGGVLRLWEPRTAKEIRRLGRSSDGVSEMALSADGSRLVTVGSEIRSSGPGMIFFPTSNNRMRFWDVTSGKEIRQLVLTTKKKTKGDPADLNGIGFGPDGKTVWTCEEEGVLRAWDWDSGKEVRCFADHPGQSDVLAFAFAPGGKSLAVVEAEQIIRVRHAETGRDLIPQIEHRQRIIKASISRDGRMAATVSAGGAFCLWELATGRFRRQLPERGTIIGTSFDLSGERRIVPFGDTVSPDGRTTARANANEIHLYDTASDRKIRTLSGASDIPWHVAFSRDGRQVLAWTADRKWHQWDLSTGKHTEQRCLDLTDETPFATAFSPDRRLAAFALGDQIAVVDHNTVREVRRITEPFEGDREALIFTLAFSPDGRTLAWAAVEDSTIYLTEIASGRVRHRLEGHQNDIESLVFSSNGRHLVSISRDATALVWDLTQLPNAAYRPLTREDLDSCWTDLRHTDAKRAYAAQLRLRQDPQRAVLDLTQRLHPVVALEERRLAQRLADLDDDQFAIRAAATTELALLVDVVEASLRRELAKRPSLEIRRRVEALLEQLDVSRSPERLRQLRTVEILEAIGTPESRKLLQKLAEGTPAALQTREAKASLQR